MRWRDYQLDDTVSRTTETLTLWRTEKGLLTINQNTLATLIRIRDKERGYVFHGQGRLLIDAIVETDDGALGKSVEREINAPFLMLGNPKEIAEHLKSATKEDLDGMGYETPQEFTVKAEGFCQQFFRGRGHHHNSHGEGDGQIFAFDDGDGQFDVLVVKGSRIVYKAKEMTYVANRGNTVLTMPGKVVAAHNGKSVIVENGRSIAISNT